MPQDDDEVYDGQSYPVRTDLDPQPKREVKPAKSLIPASESWDSHWSLAARVKVLAVMLSVNLIAFPIGWTLLDSFSAALSTLVTMSLLQTFLIGTFDRITLSRSSKGAISLIRAWRVAFFPLEPKRVRWSGFESLRIVQMGGSHIEDWILFVILLPYGGILALLWWWFVIRPERVNVALCTAHGVADTILYRSTDMAQAKKVATSIAAMTGMPMND